MRAGTVVVGDQLVVVRRHACYQVRVRSIQIGDTPYERLELSDGQEIGLRLTAAAKKGSVLMRLPALIPPAPQEPAPEPLSPDEFPSGETEEAPPDADSP